MSRYVYEVDNNVKSKYYAHGHSTNAPHAHFVLARMHKVLRPFSTVHILRIALGRNILRRTRVLQAIVQSAHDF